MPSAINTMTTSLSGGGMDKMLPDGVNVDITTIGTTVPEPGVFTTVRGTTITATSGFVGATTGALNGTLGATTPASAVVTTLTANGISTLQSGQIQAIRVVVAAGTVTAATTDFAIVVNKTVGAATTVNLFATPATGTTLVIKDGKGDAASNNITITPAAGNIDGAATYVLSTNFGSIMCIYNGAQWNLI